MEATIPRDYVPLFARLKAMGEDVGPDNRDAALNRRWSRDKICAGDKSENPQRTQ